MSAYTLFFNALVSAFPDDSPDPAFARWVSETNDQARYNVKAKRIETLALSNGTLRNLEPQALLRTDWEIIIMRVIGWAQVETVGVDTDGTTAVHGYSPAFGTSIFPGYVSLSTYNLDSIKIRGLADGTVVEYILCKAEEDS